MTRNSEPPTEPTPLTQLLLVEDEASLRSLLARFLERAAGRRHRRQRVARLRAEA